MELRPLTSADMEQVRVWRHQVPESLRTPYMLTAEMQQDYYRDVICNRDSTTRYWGLWEWNSGEYALVQSDHCTTTYKGAWQFIGYGGIENISNENGNGEISLLIGPDYRGNGYGKQAVGLFLDQAFNHLRLEHVYGECYECGPWEFWREMVIKYDTDWQSVWLPARKYYKGEYFDSYYFTFSAEGYRSHTGTDREQADPTEEHSQLWRETYCDVPDPGGP